MWLNCCVHINEPTLVQLQQKVTTSNRRSGMARSEPAMPAQTSSSSRATAGPLFRGNGRRPAGFKQTDIIRTIKALYHVPARNKAALSAGGTQSVTTGRF